MLCFMNHVLTNRERTALEQIQTRYLSEEELSSSANLTPEQAASVVGRLSDLGFVEQSTSTDGMRLQLTDAGRRYLASADI